MKRYDYADRGTYFFVALALAVGIFALYMLFSPDQQSAIPEEAHIDSHSVPAGMPAREDMAIAVDDPGALFDSKIREGGSSLPLLPGDAPADETQDKISFYNTPPSLNLPDTPEAMAGILGDDFAVFTPEAQPYEPPAWIKNAVPVAVRTKPNISKIVIIIDDLGENRKWTNAAIALPAPLTLAYLPYPRNIERYVEKGRVAGHEILVHMPMEPMGGYDSDADYMLRADMDRDKLREVLRRNLEVFDGYVGINNHMGSRFTQNAETMGWVMQDISEKGLLFVDSRTIHTSQAQAAARAFGVPFAERDVFIDHDTDRASVDAALNKVEEIATEYGLAIAIGHPKKETIEALRDWLPSLESRGFTVIPVSAAVQMTAKPPAFLSGSSPEIKARVVTPGTLPQQPSQPPE